MFPANYHVLMLSRIDFHVNSQAGSLVPRCWQTPFMVENLILILSLATNYVDTVFIKLRLNVLAPSSQHSRL